MSRLAVALVLTAGVCAAAVAQEAPVPARLSLDEAVRIAVARSPRLAAARAEISIADADAAAASMRPNPVMALESQGYPIGQSPRASFFDTQELTVRADQQIETGGRRRLRSQAARSGIAAAGASARDQLRLLQLDVRRAYMQVVLTTADLEAARATLGDIDKVLEINRASYEAGELSGVELRRLQVERFRFSDDVLTAELGRKNASSALLALLGLTPLDQPFEAIDPLALPPGAAPPPPPADVDLQRRPDIEAWRHVEERAESEQALQRALRTPNVTLGAGWQRNFGSNALVFGVTVPLPLFDRNQAGTARAEAERRLARARAEEAAVASRLEVQTALHGVEASRTRVDDIDRGYLKDAREARDIVLASYRAGAATLSDYLDAQRALREAHRTQNRARFDYRISLFQLDAALGVTAPAAGLD